MRSVITIGLAMVALPFAVSAQKNPKPLAPDSPKGLDQQYKAVLQAFEKGDEQETKASIEVFAMPRHWFVDVFGADRGPSLAKQYDEVFQDFTSAMIGELRSAVYSSRMFPRSAQISAKPQKESIPEGVPPSVLPLPQVWQFEIRYRSGPIIDDIPPLTSSQIVPPPRKFIAPGRDDSWVESFAYIDGAFRFFGAGRYAFWQPCSKSGPLPGGYLNQRVQPTFPASVDWWEVQPFFVQLRLRVQEDGSVKKIEILQGDSRLVDAARQAVSQWHYEPFKNCGQPIEKELTVVVSFDP